MSISIMSKYIKTSNGRVAKVIAAGDYVDWLALIRLKTNTEKKELAHDIIDSLGEDIYSNVLNDVINYLEALEKKTNEQKRQLQRAIRKAID